MAHLAPPSPIPELNNSVAELINLKPLREQSVRQLVELLKTAPGKKVLILDPKLLNNLDVFVDYTTIKENGVAQIILLMPGVLNTDCTTLVYLTRPRVSYMRVISEHIHDHKMKGQAKDYYLFFVPQKTYICERILEENGIYQDLKIGVYPLDVFPMDSDVFSLELDGCFREVNLEGDKSSLYSVAKALMRIQKAFGFFPVIKGKGAAAKIVFDLLQRLRRELSPDEQLPTPQIDQLILIDRSVDMVTPMCTQLTYEGLIDETFNINNNTIQLEAGLIQPPSDDRKGPGPVPAAPKQPPIDPKKKIPFALNSNDKFYSEIRDLNFSVLGPVLSKKAKSIDEFYKRRFEFKTVNVDIKEMRDFTQRLGPLQQEHQALRVHTNIAEKILQKTKERSFHRRLEAEQSLLAGSDVELSSEYIEEAIYRQEPLVKVLRLLILQSVTNSGIKPKTLEFLKREIVQTYGYETLFTIAGLEKMGLIRRQEGRSQFPLLRKGLRLYVEDIDEQNPQDIAYVFSIYAPLSIRLVQSALSPSGWRSIGEELKILPGPHFDELINENPSGSSSSSSSGSGSGSGTKNSVVLVFFIGGVTYTEISALRFLRQQAGVGRDFLIGATKIVNGDSLLQSVFDNIIQYPSTVSK
eukprot:TRINITY_DN12756_c0_g1_i1.p1 TRINITY_DN12756_c0_g1~~TRINITY_DN12756_c0_g1_i1.p1  ORF type:complete len:645 (-),score=157.59 TRINITY_DN12756_c0_g1_i1:935-2845(-)